mgnify:CR=1 FL=1
MLSGRYYPRSFTVLVIVAMGVLTVPLTSGLVNAIHVLQGAAETQRQFASNSLVVTRDTRAIVDAVSQLQRAAGQYHLLRDVEFDPVLRARHDTLENQLDALAPRLNDALTRATLDRLRQQSQTLYARLQPGAFLESAQFRALDGDFDALHREAGALLEQADAAIRHDTRTLEREMRSTQRRLLLLALALIPLTLLLAAVFSWMINRPIRQIKAAIQQLGQADLSPLPAVSGPQDIVELGRELDWLRQRLQALEEQKLRFLRHVSHELKTPLASLREGVALLNDELAGSLNPRQRSIVGIMDGGSRDLQKRIEDLIRYGGMVRDGGKPQAAPQPLAAVLDAVLARQRLTLAARGLRVEKQLLAEQIRAERNQLETVLDNLLSNAVKFSPEGGRILVKSEAVENGVVLWVCDEGEGIPEAERGRVFEPFFQGARQPAAAVKGSGLGLSIVREALLAAGGSVAVADLPPWGACFRLTWPDEAFPD